MNNLEIKIEYDKVYSRKNARFFIDGQDLIELVRKYEKKHYSEDVAAGGLYAPIHSLKWNNEYYFTRSTKSGDFLDKNGVALLMVCDCQEWGCWNTFCKIKVLENKVIWYDFNKHHRDWKYDWKFEFNKDHYMKECIRVQSLLADDSSY